MADTYPAEPHLMEPPASPIATQETGKSLADAFPELPDVRADLPFAIYSPLLTITAHSLVLWEGENPRELAYCIKQQALELADAVAEALSSAERRNEELVGRAVDAENRLSDQIRVANEALAICALWKERADEAERRNEELVRERDEAVRKFGALQIEMAVARYEEGQADARAEAAESALASLTEMCTSLDEHAEADNRVIHRLAEENRNIKSALASLTGQVGEMRERAAKVADEYANSFTMRDVDKAAVTPATFYAHDLVAMTTRAIATRIRALASGREDGGPLATTPAPTLDGAGRR